MRLSRVVNRLERSISTVGIAESGSVLWSRSLEEHSGSPPRKVLTSCCSPCQGCETCPPSAPPESLVVQPSAAVRKACARKYDGEGSSPFLVRWNGNDRKWRSVCRILNADTKPPVRAVRVVQRPPIRTLHVGLLGLQHTLCLRLKRRSQLHSLHVRVIYPNQSCYCSNHARTVQPFIPPSYPYSSPNRS
jgi:hypothetical protein